MSRIALALHEAEIQSCHPVMAELRPHVTIEEFVERVRRQEQQSGYRLVYLEDGGKVKSVAGFRISECLAWGKFLYVDDLVSGADDRSRGYGGALFNWLVEYARSESCAELHLDSGVQRFGAHRFYLQKGMDITSHHFAMKLRA